MKRSGWQCGIDCGEPHRQALGHSQQVARIQVDMWIARRMHVAHRAIHHRRLLDQRHELGGLEVAGPPGLDGGVARLALQQR